MCYMHFVLMSSQWDVEKGLMSFEVHHHGHLLIKGEQGYAFEEGEVTFIDDFDSDYISKFVIDEFGDELGLQAPYTVFFMNLETNELEMIISDIRIHRMIALDIEPERVCKLYFKDATPLAFIDENVKKTQAEEMQSEPMEVECTFDSEDQAYQFENETQQDQGTDYNANDDEEWLNDRNVDDEEVGNVDDPVNPEENICPQIEGEGNEDIPEKGSGNGGNQEEGVGNEADQEDIEDNEGGAARSSNELVESDYE